MREKARQYDRQVGTYALFTVVAAQTDRAAQARAQMLVDNADMTAVQSWSGALATDKGGGMATAMQAETFMGIPTIIGSYFTQKHGKREAQSLQGFLASELGGFNRLGLKSHDEDLQYNALLPRY